MPKSLMSHRAPALSGLQYPIISLAWISYYSVLCQLWFGHTGQLNPLLSPCSSSNVVVVLCLGLLHKTVFSPTYLSFLSCLHVPPHLFPTFAQMSQKSSSFLPKLPYTQPPAWTPSLALPLLCYNIPSAIGKKYYFDSFSHLSSK